MNDVINPPSARPFISPSAVQESREALDEIEVRLTIKGWSHKGGGASSLALISAGHFMSDVYFSIVFPLFLRGSTNLTSPFYRRVGLYF